MVPEIQWAVGRDGAEWRRVDETTDCGEEASRRLVCGVLSLQEEPHRSTC